MKVNYSQCVGGLASDIAIDLTNYSECHMIIKKSDVVTKMQVITSKGAVGSWTGLENSNVILNIPVTEEGTTEYIGNIEKFNGTYYLGVQSWNEKTNMDVLAWWLE